MWKRQIKETATAILEKRIAGSVLAMNQAQESANSEDKSSAGDKYETSRSMGQRDRDMYAGQLAQARQELAFLNNIDTEMLHENAGTGTVIFTGKLVFFIALGLGMADLNDRKIVFLSAQAPLAGVLKTKKKGSTFLLNGQELEILELF